VTRPEPAETAEQVAFLRAVNVGGVRIAMADLRKVASGLGWADPRTHLNSGNLIVRTEEPPAGEVESRLRSGIRQRLGADVPVLVRGVDELRAALERCPFSVAPGEETTLQVAILSEPPAGELDWPGPERVLVSGREAFVRFPEGVGRSKLTLARLERGLGVVATLRGIRTIRALAERPAAG